MCGQDVEGVAAAVSPQEFALIRRSREPLIMEPSLGNEPKNEKALVYFESFWFFRNSWGDRNSRGWPCACPVEGNHALHRVSIP